MSNLQEIQDELQSKRKELQHELNRIDAAISALSGLGRPTATVTSAPAAETGRRILSIGARRRIAAAQRARWAKVRAGKTGAPKKEIAVVGQKKTRVMSADARRRIAAAQRARWARVRAQKKAA
jgi:hypothetical protein